MLCRGPRGTGEVKNSKFFKNFVGRAETITMIPHNPNLSIRGNLSKKIQVMKQIGVPLMKKSPPPFLDYQKPL